MGWVLVGTHWYPLERDQKESPEAKVGWERGKENPPHCHSYVLI